LGVTFSQTVQLIGLCLVNNSSMSSGTPGNFLLKGKKEETPLLVMTQPA
jgi:hypothetical protein